MPSIAYHAYARDLSHLGRAYAAGPTCNGVDCHSIPNCDQAQACVGQCGLGVLQNCPGGKGKSPLSDFLNYTGTGASRAGNNVAHGAGQISKNFNDAVRSTEDAFKSSLGALTAPCAWAMKVPGLNQVPCWLTYMIIVLGLVVVITKVR